MASLSAGALVGIFVASACVIWAAGIRLSRSTDALDERLGLGSAVGGLLLLAIATSLPELAITVSAALSNNIELAIGNLIGGIAIQTVVLAALDAGVRGDRPLTYLAGSLVLLLEALNVMAIVAVALMTTQLPSSDNVAGLSPGSLAILLAWLGGLLLVRSASQGLPWEAKAPQARPGRPHKRVKPAGREHPLSGHSTRAVTLIFAAAALATLVGGVAIEESGSELAVRLGFGAGIFGATVIAAATALPELSTGLAAVRLGDHQLAMSDIFGGNAFMPTLFVIADLLAGRPALPQAKPSDIWLAALGVLVTGIYAVGLLTRPKRRHARLGMDSIAVIGLYALGVIGLIAINGAGG